MCWIAPRCFSLAKADQQVRRLSIAAGEFDFRYNEREALGVSDAERMSKAIPGIVGKRLTYRRTGLGANI